MRVSTHGRLYVGRLEVLKPLHDLTPDQRITLATTLEVWASDITTGKATGRVLVDLYVEVE